MMMMMMMIVSSLFFFLSWIILIAFPVYGFVPDYRISTHGRTISTLPYNDDRWFSIGGRVMATTPSADGAAATSATSAPSPLKKKNPDRRRRVILASSLFGGLFGGGGGSGANAKTKANNIVKTVNGMRYRRLGKSDIVVSELGLGTQRWVSADYNAPDATTCFAMMDTAILQNGGVNLLDTAEQYPIPSDGSKANEGDSERLIGQWLQARKESINRSDVVIATKITGGRNVTPLNIQKDCESSLRRLGTDYIDIYQLHWPQRYSPQSNWGQSLQYHVETDADSPYWRANGGPTSFPDLCNAMEKLIQQGKIRGWGLCNDNAYGLTACCTTAKLLGTTPPCSIQGDFSLIDRKSEENGVAEAASPFNENVGFMAYNALAGGMLTGKYQNVPAAPDDNADRDRARRSLEQPRGRMDTRGWGRTLYRYRSTAAQAAIRDYDDIRQKYGMSSLTELSLRWCRQRSLVTTTLVGHSNLSQLQECIRYFTMPDRVHMKNRLPIFSSDRVGSDWAGRGEIGETIP
jgi:aryl-alcohol dehydrogenase-like predicted oxidoreductase